MLAPKKVKYRKPHRRSPADKAMTKTTISFGEFGLKSTTSGWITARQIEACRRAMARHLKRGGKMWVRIFPDTARTSKGTQATMGGGKGVPEEFMAIVPAGTVLFELSGIPEALARESLHLASYKLPVKSTFIVR